MPKATDSPLPTSEDVWRSTLGSNLSFKVLHEDGIPSGATKVLIQRRRVDRTTGEIKIEEHERVVLDRDWATFTKGYEKG